MGSYFSPDDYRLESVHYNFKKDFGNFAQFNRSISPTGGLLDNNVCFANIKKELGFFDDCPRLNTPPGEQLFQDSKARSSPVVERLILEEIQNDFADYATQLQIAVDPEQWSADDTRRWLIWMCGQHQLLDYSSCLPYDGHTLCTLTEENVNMMVGSVSAGTKIYGQIEMWKNAFKLAPSAGFIQFQQQQAEDSCRFNNEDVKMSGPKMMDQGCSWSNNDRYISMVPPQQNQQPNSLPQSNLPQFGNIKVPDFRLYEHRPTIPQDRNLLYRNLMSQQQQQQQSYDNSFKCQPENTTPQNIFNYTYLGENVQRPCYTNLQNRSAEVSASLEISREFNAPGQPTPLSLQTTVIPKTEPGKPTSKPVKEEKKPTGDQPQKPRKTKHTTHLWEFLKELLLEEKECIRWVDKEKGIFKIYNSQEVAKYWGQRKNRPAMNYDKLSRSIRQYYKKGIIKKTTQGKRLVYQFCDEYR